jgi:hypothetical protein
MATVLPDETLEQYRDRLRADDHGFNQDQINSNVSYLKNNGYMATLGTIMTISTMNASTPVYDEDDDDHTEKMDPYTIIKIIRQYLQLIMDKWQDGTYQPTAEDQQFINQTTKIMWQLEVGVKWPSDLPENPSESDTPALVIYRQRFGEALKNAATSCIGSNNNCEIRLFVIIYGRAMYDAEVRAFPGPARFDPQEAMRDAMGMNDMFAELFEEHMQKSLQQFVECVMPND